MSLVEIPANCIGDWDLGSRENLLIATASMFLSTEKQFRIITFNFQVLTEYSQTCIIGWDREISAESGGGSNSINVCSPPDFGKMFTKSTDKNRQNRQK